MNLDNVEEIKKLDKGNIYGSIQSLSGQIRQAWDGVNALTEPKECSLASNVVICGMGGSALGGRIIRSLFSDRLRTPIEVLTEFNLPNYVNEKTLVILSSYSGNTQETLSAAHEALKRNAKIFGIATGGKLANFLVSNNLPGYIFEPHNNPSNQPRMGLGYSIVATIAILAKCSFISFSTDEIVSIIETVDKFTKEWGSSVPEKDNLAKLTSKKLFGKIAVMIASEHLIGIVHAFKNQLNENAKNFAALYDIPELDHHLLEGLRNPAQAKEFYYFLFIESKHYHREILKRFPIVRQVVEKNDIETGVYISRSDTKLLQVFELLVFGSYVSFYLAMLYGLDPAPIPWVDYFKEKLG